MRDELPAAYGFPWLNFCDRFCSNSLSNRRAIWKECEMRVSDDRYSRDRLRYDLALRLIRHEARTHTIRQWTGLTDDRIRKLYRSYAMHPGTRRVLRHRGKSPRQAAFFFKSPESKFQSAQLASLFLIYDLVDGTTDAFPSGFRAGSLDGGLLLCRAYEAYLELHAPAIISFEHAWFLLLALRRRDEIALRRCTECGGVLLQDLFAKRGASCLTCAPGNAQSG
jgi:hypothetical protein